MKSETQLGFELGIDKRVIVSIRKRSLSRTLWFTKSNPVYYTLQGEHKLRNEIQKTVLRLLDAWKASVERFLSTTFSQKKVNCMRTIPSFNSTSRVTRPPYREKIVNLSFISWFFAFKDSISAKKSFRVILLHLRAWIGIHFHRLTWSQ